MGQQGRRVARLNSLLKEVISEVIQRDVKNPHLPSLITVTNVEVSQDVRHARVYISVIGDATQKSQAIAVLQSASGFIATHASKKVTLRFFPDLTFHIDESVEKHMRISTLISEIQAERKEREKEGQDE